VSSAIYLHFMNREIHRSVGVEIADGYVRSGLITATCLSGDPLIVSLGLLWESAEASKGLESFLVELVESSNLLVSSEYSDIEAHLAAARAMYSGASERYPMYFEDRPGMASRIRPTLPKPASTTAFLASQLHGLVEGDPTAASALGRRDATKLLSARETINHALRQRDDEALTMDYFGRVTNSEDDTRTIGRMLSYLHTEHYLSQYSADIVTGLSGLASYDSLSRGFPLLDRRIFDAIMRTTWAPRRQRPDSTLQDIVRNRNSDAHRRFLSYYRATVLALIDLDGLDSLSPPLRVSRVIRSLRPAVDSGNILARVGFFEALGTTLKRTSARLAKLQPGFQEHFIIHQRGVGQLTKSVLLVCATVTERNAIIRVLMDSSETSGVNRTFLPRHTVFDLGVVGGVEVSLVQTEVGTEHPGATTLALSEVLTELSPDFVISIGICLGLRPDEQALGDVVVSSQVRLTDPKKITATLWDSRQLRILRGDKVSASVILLDRLRSETIVWRGPAVHFGLMLSGNTLVNHPDVVKQMRNDEPDAIAGEMEGGGIYAASTVFGAQWIIVKGISDWGFDKSDVSQESAAANAATFVLSMLSSGALR